MIDLAIQQQRRDFGGAVGRVLSHFASPAQERIERAKADWRAGRIELSDGDSDEFNPLPGDAVPANPMS